MKRRMALLAVLAGANFVPSVSGRVAGDCSSCAVIEYEEGKFAKACVTGLEKGYQSCFGGHGSKDPILPCVNSAFTCGKDPE